MNKNTTQPLRDIGFRFQTDHSNFGTKLAEDYNVGKNHFCPSFRYVYIGTAVSGCYVTSSIKGTWRGYRCRNSWDKDIGNIFGHGKTVDDAIKNFVNNFNNKVYNVRN